MATTDARFIPFKNAAYRVTFPIFDADGDLVVGAAGLDSEVSLDGGTFADCTNEATEIATSSGVYFLDLTVAEMNADTVAVIVKTTTAGAKTTVLVLYPEEVGDIRVNVTQQANIDFGALQKTSLNAATPASVQGAVGSVTADVGITQAGADKVWATTARTLTAFAQAFSDQVWSTATRTLTAFSTTLALSVWDVLETAIATVSSIGLKLKNNLDVVLSTRAPEAGGNIAAILDDTGTSGVVLPQAQADKVWGTAARALTDKTDFALSAAGIDAIWDELMSGHTTSGSFGQRFQVVRTGTAQAGGASTITLDAGASAVDNFYNTEVIFILSGTGAGQSRKINSYVGTTKVATLTSAWATAPDATSIFIIFPESVETGTGATAQQVWEYATRALTDKAGFTISGTKQTLDALNDITAAAVWAVATRALTDKADFALSAASRLAIWHELLSGIVTAGTIGKLIKDDLDATITSRSSHSAADVWAVTTRALTDKVGFALSAAGIQAIWDALTSALTTTGSIGKKLADWVVGTIDTYTGNTKQTGNVGVAGAGLTAVPWNATWDAEVQSEVQDAIEVNHLDHLLAVDYDPAAKPGIVTALLNELIEDDAGVSRYTTNALEQAPGGGTGLTAQQTRDAMKLAPSVGVPIDGSVDKHLDDILTGPLTVTIPKAFHP